MRPRFIHGSCCSALCNLNAAAVIFAHQHPSGSTEPSNADRVLTEQLKTALALIDVRVLDHFVIGQGTPYSFAESVFVGKHVVH